MPNPFFSALDMNRVYSAVICRRDSLQRDHRFSMGTLRRRKQNVGASYGGDQSQVEINPSLISRLLKWIAYLFSVAIHLSTPICTVDASKEYIYWVLKMFVTPGSKQAGVSRS